MRIYNCPTLLYLGNIIPERFPPLFLKVLERLYRKLDFTILIVAPVTRVNLQHAVELMKLIRKLKLQRCVKLLLEDLDDIAKAELLARAYLFVAPFTQNLRTILIPPLSILEAISAGVPVVASRVAGTWEIVNDDIGRLLAPFSESTIEEWYNTLKTLLENKCLREVLSQNAKRITQLYDNRAVAERILRLYMAYLDKSK